jgi:hypothetical protein
VNFLLFGTNRNNLSRFFVLRWEYFHLFLHIFWHFKFLNFIHVGDISRKHERPRPYRLPWRPFYSFLLNSDLYLYRANYSWKCPYADFLWRLQNLFHLKFELVYRELRQLYVRLSWNILIHVRCRHINTGIILDSLTVSRRVHAYQMCLHIFRFCWIGQSYHRCGFDIRSGYFGIIGHQFLFPRGKAGKNCWQVEIFLLVASRA